MVNSSIPLDSVFLNDIKNFYYQNGLELKFSSRVLYEAKRLSKTPFEQSSRRDLTHLNVFTIDPEDARDFDDALSLEILDKNSYRIGVHIADVSAWVKEGSEIDKQARKRGNSFYFPWGFVPMLPERLTCDLCSLVPDEDRLAVSCLYLIEHESIAHYEFLLSIINSKCRLNYLQAQNILDGENNQEQAWLCDAIRILHEIGLTFRKERNQRGSLNFDLPEYGPVLNSKGTPEKIIEKKIYEANRLVEDWMLFTNETVASFLSQREIPILYRNHPKPGFKEMNEFHTICQALGLSSHGKNPAEKFNNVLQQAEKMEASTIIHRQLLRSLEKARYENKNQGHFGIGAKRYTHFTSPIRRYPDLTVHRALKKVIGVSANSYNSSQNQKRSFQKKKGESNYLRTLGEHCSEREKLELKMERQAFKWMAARFMKGKEGKQYSGIVSGMNEWGLFIELSDVKIEGFIHRKFLEDDYYYFDSQRFRFFGKRKGREFCIGQKLEVRLIRTDPEKRQIDFKPV